MPTRSVIENSKKIAKKLKKLENTIIASFQAKIGWEMPRKREKKKKLFRCVPTRPVIENSKKKAKKFKNFENTFIAFLQAKIGWEKVRKRESEKNLSDVLLPNP